MARFVRIRRITLGLVCTGAIFGSASPAAAATCTINSIPYTVTQTGSGTINGTTGNDVIQVSALNDTIHGNGGEDVICAGAGNDKVISGTTGKVKVDGGAGNDDFTGTPFQDLLYGGTGNDKVRGLGEFDGVFGDDGAAGDDSLVGGSGFGDYCSGSSGTDSADVSCETTAGIP